MIAANFSPSRSNEFSVEMIAKIYSVVRKKKIVGRKCQGNFPIKRTYCVISMTLSLKECNGHKMIVDLKKKRVDNFRSVSTSNLHFFFMLYTYRKNLKKGTLLQWTDITLITIISLYSVLSQFESFLLLSLLQTLGDLRPPGYLPSLLDSWEIVRNKVLCSHACTFTVLGNIVSNAAGGGWHCTCWWKQQFFPQIFFFSM